MTPFKTIWPNFIIVYPIDSFQDHLTQFYYCVPYLLLSRPFDLIFVLSTQLTPFNTIWPNFIIVYTIDSFQDHLTSFIIVYQIDSFQHHLTQFYHCVPNWLLSRPFDLNLIFCTQLTPFKTIWPYFIIVYPNDSFQDLMTWLVYCVPNWLLSRPLTPFKTIWLGQMVLKGVNWVHNAKIRSYGLEGSHLGTQW